MDESAHVNVREPTLCFSDPDGVSTELYSSISDVERDIFDNVLPVIREHFVQIQEMIHDTLLKRKLIPVTHLGETKPLEMVVGPLECEDGSLLITCFLTEHYFTGFATLDDKKMSEEFYRLLNYGLQDMFFEFVHVDRDARKPN